MRVCIFSPDAISDRDVRSVVDRIQHGAAEKVEVTCLTNYPWAKDGPEAENPRVVAGSDGLKMRVCRKLFDIADKHSWIPSFPGFLALRLCERQILEALVASDPDVIVCLKPGWTTPLQRLVNKWHLQWLCVTPTEPLSHVDREWRKYDPSVKVSIVLPTYNGSKYIRQSVESCLSQTHENIELLVVDDGSKEDIQEIVAAHKDGRIKYFRHPKNLGLPLALNTGFKNSSGEYLTWTSDDNYYAADAIEEMVRFLQTYADVDFVYAESYLLDEDIESSTPQIRRILPPEHLKIKNEIGACFLYTRKVHETIGDYNPKFYLAEDYEYWIRVARQFKMQRLFRPLYYYRFHRDSLTRKYPQEVREKTRMIQAARPL